MQYSQLGHTDVKVSRICLGTMTWGDPNTEAEAHAQLDYAVAQGINFIDTAEMYPAPPKPETHSLTETYIGNWLKQQPNRDQLIIATKVTGSGRIDHIRGGPLLNRAHIQQAIDDSLSRLQTDYVDLYQVHWPARNANRFGQLGYEHIEETDVTPIEETLGVLAELVTTGKVRYIGVSNETPWGVMKYLSLAQSQGLPHIVSVQNPYNLLNRSYEVGLAEISHREQVSLLGYSPLAFGVLSGKYLHGARPEGARLSISSRYARYLGEHGQQATAQYVALANKHGLDPTQMALAYVNSRPFVTSSIIGATTLDQLASNIISLSVTLSEEVLAEIEAIHAHHPYPCP